nr:hypothetical protein [Candidatus Scalindua japonica]
MDDKQELSSCLDDVFTAFDHVVKTHHYEPTIHETGKVKFVGRGIHV